MRESSSRTATMLRLVSLTALGLLCLAQALPLRLRTISSRKTNSLERDERSASDHASSLIHHYPCILHHRSGLHGNETKLHLRLNSKFSMDKVVGWEATDTKAARNSAKRVEKLEDDDERRYGSRSSQIKTSNRVRRRRFVDIHHSKTSLSAPVRKVPNRVSMTSKNPHKLLNRAPNRDKPSTSLHSHHIDIQLATNFQSSGLNTVQSETRSRRRRRAAINDNSFENFSSNEMSKREQLTLPDLRSTEEEDGVDFSYDDALRDENDREDEQDLEEFVQKRQSDEVMISRAVLQAMNERIYWRVKDFIDRNTKKKTAPTGGEMKEAEKVIPVAEMKVTDKAAVPVAVIKEAEMTMRPAVEIKEAASLTTIQIAAVPGPTPLPVVPVLVTLRPTLPP